ncbi:MAG TPA: PaaI family thioesterase [Gemmatimonadaceae bacterium]|nr:PaaI family thioesterase [Gemmatimonadaceae bacterium]
MKPQDPNYDSRVRASFAKQRLMATLGALLEVVEPGRVDIRLPVREDLTQQHGFLHAGAIASVADSACGYAALSLMPSDAGVLSIEFKCNMLAPATGEAIVARGSVLRAGKTVMVCRADVYALANGSEKLVAAMQGTMMVARDRGLTD